VVLVFFVVPSCACGSCQRRFGDANVDGKVNSSDLVQVFQAGQYEDDLSFNSTWSTGDWNADGDFTTSDLVVAFQDGGYEAGPRAGVAAVPEPASWLMLISGWLSLGILRRRKWASGDGTSSETRRFGFRAAHRRVRRPVRGEEFEPRYCLSAVAFAAHDIAVGGNSVYAADVDGDGDLDVLGNTIAWYENSDGQGTFGDQRVINTKVFEAWSVHPADVDSVGDIDVLSANRGKIALYENLSPRVGDANGDDLFISTDLLLVFQAGKFEDGQAHNATFADGDWNGDQEFDSADLVLAFQLGHYQPAARAANSDIAAAVDRLFADADANRLSRSGHAFVS
jgi:hypothetical protein